jgi:hypothetical protein
MRFESICIVKSPNVGYWLSTPEQALTIQVEVNAWRRCRSTDVITSWVEDILNRGPSSVRRERAVVEKATDLAIGLEACIMDNLKRGQADYARQIELMKLNLAFRALRPATTTNRFSPECVRGYILRRTA